MKKLFYTRVHAGNVKLWEKKKPLLNNLDMELTERCNNNCIHCYINLPADDLVAKERELTTERIQAILKEAAAIGCLQVRFTGGEPLLREDFEELYLFARKLGLKVVIFTNATLITPHLAQLLAHIPPLGGIEVSVYGMKRKSYEAITRTPGSFEAAWRGINLLLEHQIPFIVKGVILPPPNREEMDEFRAWAATIPWMERHPTHSMFFDLRCRRDSDNKNRLIKRLRLPAEDVPEIFSMDGEAYFKGMQDFCSKFMGPPGDMLFSCGSGLGSGCVDAYGYFQPCMLLRHPDTIYHLEDGSLKDALLNVFPRIRQMKACNPDYLVRCARCFLKGLCDQCPAKSWTEHGTLDTPVEYLCEVAHAKAVYLGLLAEDELGWEVEDWRERVARFSEEEPR